MKNKSMTFRCSDKTIKNIQNIQKQMEQSGKFDDINISNGYIIRLAISLLNSKFKYIVWTK